ncbi:MAG: DUF4296 domain-containing protein [Rhodothermales bacterium]|nr:DUF4296 domain-containing protein [Rhodothermales bacterium]
MPDSLLVEALVELHLADARAGRTGEPRDSLRTAALAVHGLDTAAFGRALDYYADHPEAYVALYDRAIDRVLAEQQELGTLPPEAAPPTAE